MRYMNMYIKLQLTIVGVLAIFMLQVKAFSQDIATLQKSIRVGIIYSKKPAQSFTIEGDKGLHILDNQNNQQVALYIHNTNKPLSVMGDVYYGLENNSIKIIDNGSGKISSWHLKVDNEVLTYEEANNYVVYYKNKGIEVFPYYNGKWQVCTFPFDSFESVSYYKNILSKIYPNINFTIIEPGKKRILILTENKTPLMIFDSTNREVTFCPNSEGVIKINGDQKKRYRGNMAVYILSSGAITAVNVVPIEKYLYGVVPFEIGGSSPIESIKAQAVAARNYTYNSIDKHQNENFEICDTTHCQFYGGINGETATSNKSIDETTGKLLMYDGKIASLFYFSSTGGLPTEDVANVWGSNIPYLKSVESKYEAVDSYHYAWNYEYSLSKLKGLTNANIGDIIDVEIVKRSTTGRVTEVKVVGTAGEKVYKRESARMVFGLDSQYYEISSDADVFVKGTNDTKKMIVSGKNVVSFAGKSSIGSKNKTASIKSAQKSKSLSVVPQKFKFDGKGWGHAVGLSQEGAIGMAKAGIAYDQILLHFFPGTYLK